MGKKSILKEIKGFFKYIIAFLFFFLFSQYVLYVPVHVKGLESSNAESPCQWELLRDRSLLSSTRL